MMNYYVFFLSKFKEGISVKEECNQTTVGLGNKKCLEMHPTQPNNQGKLFGHQPQFIQVNTPCFLVVLAERDGSLKRNHPLLNQPEFLIAMVVYPAISTLLKHFPIPTAEPSVSGLWLHRPR